MDDTRDFEAEFDQSFSAAKKIHAHRNPWKNGTAGELDTAYQKFRTYLSDATVDREGDGWMNAMVYPAFLFCRSLVGEFSQCFFSIFFSSATDR